MVATGEMTERLMNEFVMPQLAYLVGHVSYNENNKNDENSHTITTTTTNTT